MTFGYVGTRSNHRTYNLPAEDQEENEALVMKCLDHGLTLNVRVIRVNTGLTPEAIDAALRRLEKAGSVKRIRDTQSILWRSL